MAKRQTTQHNSEPTSDLVISIASRRRSSERHALRILAQGRAALGVLLADVDDLSAAQPIGDVNVIVERQPRVIGPELRI